MKTYQLFATICLFFIFSSCVQFKEAQPQNVENINSFPIDLIGKYTDADQGILTITDKKMNYISKDGSKQLIKNLGDQCLLRAFNGMYVFNIKENENWDVFLTKSNGKDWEVYTISIGNDNKKLKKLQKTVDVDIVQNQEGGNDYLINPSKVEFQRLIDKHFFSKSNYFKRVN